MSDQHKIDEARAGSIEHFLKDKLDALKKKLKDEGTMKIKYGVSIHVYISISWLILQRLYFAKSLQKSIAQVQIFTNATSLPLHVAMHTHKKLRKLISPTLPKSTKFFCLEMYMLYCI